MKSLLLSLLLTLSFTAHAQKVIKIETPFNLDCPRSPMRFFIKSIKADGSDVTLREYGIVVEAIEKHVFRFRIDSGSSGVAIVGHPSVLAYTAHPRLKIKTLIETEFPFAQVEICPILEESPTVTGSN